MQRYGLFEDKRERWRFSRDADVVTGNWYLVQLEPMSSKDGFERWHLDHDCESHRHDCDGAGHY